MRLVRVVSIVAVALLALAAGVVVVAAVFGERLLAAAIERAGPALIGREVRLGGVSIDWGRYATAAATDLTIADAAWSSDAPMLRARRVELTVDLLDLLRLRLAPVRLALRQPALRLARDAQGRWNLPSAAGSGGAPGGGSFFEVAPPREVEVEGGAVAVDDLASPGVEARIAELSARGTPSGVEFRGTVGLEGGAPVAFSGEAGPVAALIRNGEGGGAGPFPIRLAIGPDTARLSAAGHLARPLDLAGVDLRFQAQGGDLAPLLAALGAPPAKGTPPFRFSARLTDAGRGWALRDVAARLGESRVEGEASALFAGRPKPFFGFDLAAPRVVPSDFGWIAPAGGGGAAPAGSPLDARSPTAWLRRADAEGSLRVGRLEGLAAEPAGLRAGVELENGRLLLQPLRLDLAGSAAEGSATVEAAAEGTPPKIGLRLEAEGGLRLGPLLAAFGVGDVATGTARTASVDLRGRGATLREVAAGLDGAARFRIADGSLRVPGFARLSMGLVEAFGAALGASGDAGATPVACAVGDLPVRGGVVHAERLVVVTPRVAITGEGTVRLGDGTLRLTLVPRPLDEALLRVVVPVVISGALASPKVEPHPELRLGVRPEAPADICAEGTGRR